MVTSTLLPSRTLIMPKGKSIEGPTIGTFEEANIKPKFPHVRSCIGTFADLPGFDHCLRLKPALVGQQVANGGAAAGITGLDQLIEARLLDSVVVVATLAYSKATNGGTRGVLVGKREGPGIEDLRRKRRRIISEYPEETRRFLRELGIDAEIVPCPGDAESLVASGEYDYCVVLVETGTSLTENGLVELATVFESQTVLIANPGMYADPSVRESVDFLARLLLGTIEARDNRYLTMNVPRHAFDDTMKILPSKESPTVQQLLNGWYAISSVVPLKGLAHLKLRLIKCGAKDIVEMNAHSII